MIHLKGGVAVDWVVKQDFWGKKRRKKNGAHPTEIMRIWLLVGTKKLLVAATTYLKEAVYQGGQKHWLWRPLIILTNCL